MSSGSAPRKILDLRPYLDSRPKNGQGAVLSAEEEPAELLGDSPAEVLPLAGRRPAGRRQLAPTLGLAMAVAALGFGALVMLLPVENLAPAALIVLAASLATAALVHRQIRLASRDIPDIDIQKQREHQRRREQNDLVQTITALAVALEARDPYTKDHSRHVARMSVRLGRRLGLNRNQLYEIHLAGLLHDIGKIGVPDHILLKPSRLTDEEMRIVQSHVMWSYNILSTVRGLRSIAVIVRHHHERFDGGGYPDALAGSEIPVGARVMAVADMFMAMTEDRPYRKGLPIADAVEEMRRVAGRQLDPLCVNEFLAMMDEDRFYPVAGESGSKRAAAN